MAGSIKGIIVEIGGDTSGLQKALSKVNSATSSLSRELRGVNSLLKLDPKNTELLSQKQIVLNQEIGKTEEKLRILKETQEKANKTLEEGGEVSQENYRALQREIASTETKLKQLKAEASKWTTAGRKVEEFGNKITDVSSKVENLGNKLSKMLTTSILAIGTLATKSAMNFETAFAGVEKTVDGTVEQMKALEQGIKDMATQLPSTTTEIAGVAEAAGQLGIETDNILDFSKAMIDLGNSTNLTAEEAATQLARFANITQMSQKDFQKLGSSIVDLGNNFATTEAEIVDMAMRLAGAGKQVGFSEGQILGLATALSSVGVEAEMGGSAISKAMVKMQNAVEMGGTKLSKVLSKTGLTLRELELMSANNSKEFKELSQSIGMTSTEVKQLLTAGTNLEDFAKISGMSAKEFQKAWKEDASGALTEFIKGLGDAESKGESAITMLSEMGLTEVRLRDSLLRAANAGTLLSDAIETGTEAFEDNTALAKEANKRYATLESRFKKTLNKTNNLAINLGKKLTPSINKILDKVDKFIDKLDDLSEEEIENIIQIGLMVASVGPLIKILGKVGTSIGTVSKGIGIFSQAVAVASNKTTSEITSVNNLAKAFSALTSPVGLATLGITAGITALVVAFQKATEETRNYAKETEESLQSVLKEKEAIDELKASIDTESQAKLYEVERSRDLWEELKKITDENGKIKKGYENRAKVITNELSEALGTEISITNNVVDKYKELQKEIDNLILKKKAEIILNANEEKYAEAIKNRTQKAQELLDKQDELNKAKEEENKLYEEYEKTVKDVWKASLFQNLVAEQNWKNQKEAVSNLKNEVSTLSKIVDGYTQDMQDYNYNFELYSEGTKESLTELSNTVQQTYQKNGETVKTSYAEQIKEQQIYLSKAKSLNEQAIKENNETETKKTQDTITESDKRLTKITEELTSQTSLVEENSPDVVSAWKQLATNSYDKYSIELKKMPKEMREKIEDITGVVSNDETVAKEMEELAKESVKAFEENANTFDTGKFFVMGLKDGLNDGKTRDLLFSSVISLGKKMISSLNNSLDEHSPSEETKKSGINFIQGLINGINSKQREALNLVSKFGTNMTSNLNNNLLNGNMEFSNSKLSSQVIDSTKTIFTTPQIVFNVQELDEARLNQCFNYVNRKFGSQY